MKTNSYLNSYLKDEDKSKSKKKKIIIIAIIVLCIVFNPIAYLKNKIYDNAAKIKEENDEDLKFVGLFQKPMKGETFKDFGNNPEVGGGSIYHSGIDISTKKDADVVAAYKGTVVAIGYNDEYHNYIEIKHDTPKGTLYTVYGELSETNVYMSQSVVKGQKIGEVNIKSLRGDDDETFVTKIGYLHFEIRKGIERGTEINPRSYVIF